MESLLLAACGGAGGVLLGIGVTTAYATYQHWPSPVPAWASAGGVGAMLVIGALAGLYPAWRAAQPLPMSRYPAACRRVSNSAGSTTWGALPLARLLCTGVRWTPRPG